MSFLTGLLGAIPVEWLLAAGGALVAAVFGWRQRKSGEKTGRSLERARATEQDAAAAAQVRERARAVSDDLPDGDAADWLRDRFSAPGGRSEPKG